MFNSVFKLRLLFGTFIFIVVFWLSIMAIVPSGKITYRFDCTGDEFVSKLTPKERVNLLNKKCVQEISGNPVYFNLRTPRIFSKAILKLKYSLVKPVRLFEVGVLADKNIWRYDLRPVQNTMIDNLQWSSIVDGNLILFQKNKKFNTITDFKKEVLDISRVATYNYNLKYNYLIPDYQATYSERLFNLPLRGDYQLFTYLKNEKLKFIFSLKDLNQNRDQDVVIVNLYKDDKLIVSESLVDDGENGDTNRASGVRKLQLEKDGLPEGVYKIQVVANDDIVTEKISTVQEKISFVGKIWLLKNNAKNIKLFTDSNKLQIKTINPDSLQEVIIGKQKLAIAETYKQFEIAVNKGAAKLEKIELKNDGLIISGDGIFVFNEADYLNPKVKKVDENFQEKNFDYVLASYSSPKSNDGVYEQEIKFDLTGAYRENGRYSFLLSLPELKDGSSTAVIISDIQVELSRRSIFERFFR